MLLKDNGSTIAQLVEYQIFNLRAKGLNPLSGMVFLDNLFHLYKNAKCTFHE